MTCNSSYHNKPVPAAPRSPQKKTATQRAFEEDTAVFVRRSQSILCLAIARLVLQLWQK